MRDIVVMLVCAYILVFVHNKLVETLGYKQTSMSASILFV